MNKKYAKILLVVLLLAVIASSMFALSACNKQQPEREVFGESRIYELDFAYTNVMDQPMVGLILNLLLDPVESCFEFGTDGVVRGKLQTQTLNLNSLLDMAGSFSSGITKDSIAAQIGAVDVASMLNSNVEPMFPGIVSRIVDGDLKGALELVQKTMGLNITGIDFEDEEIKKAVLKMGEEYTRTNGKNMHLPSNLLDLIPEELCVAVTAEWEYELVHLKGSDGTPHDAVYIGGVSHNVNTQPFGVFTMTTSSNGTQRMVLRVEFLDVDFGLKLRTQQ